MCQYLENCRRYVQSYYLWLIGSCICAFDWHHDRWPWMTLNSITLNFQRISRISQISDATTAKRMKPGQYCQRQCRKHVELEQFWHVFASRGFVSDNWAFLFDLRNSALLLYLILWRFLFLYWLEVTQICATALSVVSTLVKTELNNTDECRCFHDVKRTQWSSQLVINWFIKHN